MCNVWVCSPNSLSVSWLALIRVRDIPAISSDVMNEPDITLATTTPRLSVTVETANHITQHLQIHLPLKRGQRRLVTLYYWWCYSLALQVAGCG